MAQTIVEEPAIQESGLSCGCGCEQVHETAPEMPDEELLYDLADLFKVFADTTRIKILYALMGRELSVGDLAEVIGATQSAVSHQLRTLKQKCDLLAFRRPRIHDDRSGHDPYLRISQPTCMSERIKPCVRRLNSTNLNARTAERKWRPPLRKSMALLMPK